MCGIVGYIGKERAYDILIHGLHRLEYRGYDSAGVAIGKKDGTLNVYKSRGKAADSEAGVEGKDIEGNILYPCGRLSCGRDEAQADRPHDNEMPTAIIAPSDSLYDKIISNVQRVKLRGGLVIVSKGNRRWNISSTTAWRYPKCLNA